MNSGVGAEGVSLFGWFVFKEYSFTSYNICGGEVGVRARRV